MVMISSRTLRWCVSILDSTSTSTQSSLPTHCASLIRRGHVIPPCSRYRVIIGIGAAFLFTNSSAIITDSFAPYGQVGAAQGVFQARCCSSGIAWGLMHAIRLRAMCVWCDTLCSCDRYVATYSLLYTLCAGFRRKWRHSRTSHRRCTR